MLAALMLALLATAKTPSPCQLELTARGVPFAPARLGWIADGVRLTGPIEGIRYVYGSAARPIVIDCSLALSLAEAARYLRPAGVDTVYVASAYARRYVRGTTRWSKHAYGLALDVYALGGPELGTLEVARHYEMGLDRGYDCLGAPGDDAAKQLRLIFCQLTYSELFHLVLSPDYDSDHDDHFHLEAAPWAKRPALRSGRPAIH
ncbi:MAG: extensin family protein [Myxococcales bacterium]|nr:extensin family protein [Myxococcales bacterium]